jgi:hypothetical protein
MVKVCCCCRQPFEASQTHFYVQKRNPDGLRADCKQCFNTRYRPNWIPLPKKPKKTIQQINREQYLRIKADPALKIVKYTRSRTLLALKGGFYKSNRTLKLLGCSPKFLKEYLESKFTRGMNWSNHGRFGWHIDHIKPCASFDLSKPAEQAKCFHYSNLQPLWWQDNLQKPKLT